MSAFGTKQTRQPSSANLADPLAPTARETAMPDRVRHD